MGDLQRTIYPHKWSPISCRLSAGQGKFASQRPTFYQLCHANKFVRTAWCGAHGNFCRKKLMPSFPSLFLAFPSLPYFPSLPTSPLRIPACLAILPQSGLFNPARRSVTTMVLHNRELVKHVFNESDILIHDILQNAIVLEWPSLSQRFTEHRRTEKLPTMCHFTGGRIWMKFFSEIPS